MTKAGSGGRGGVSAKVAPSKPRTPDGLSKEALRANGIRVIDPEAIAVLAGFGFTAATIKGISGGLPGAKIEVSLESSGMSNRPGSRQRPRVYFDVRHRSLQEPATRIVTKDAKGRLMVRNHFLVTKDSARGKHIARDMLRRQVVASRRVGVHRIVTNAASSEYLQNKQVRRFDGYWKWPLYGYNARLSRDTRAKAASAGFRNVTSIQSLYRQKGGIEWWRANGAGTVMTFNPKRGSRSSQILARRISSKRAGS